MSRFSTWRCAQIQNNSVFPMFNLPESLLHKHRTGFLYVIGSGMKYGIERKRRPFFEEYSCFAPWNLFHRIWNLVEFVWVGSQTNGQKLIDLFNKTIKVNRKLVFYSLQKSNYQYFVYLFDGFFEFSCDICGKII